MFDDIDATTWVQRYRRINSSFTRTLVFHIGTHAGFLSEYNNMILAMLYCLRNQIRFQLTSTCANFAFDKGYEDYFLPFLEEDRNWYNRYFNTRPTLIDNEAVFKKRASQIKEMYGIDFFTQDLWDEIRNAGEAFFDMQELGVHGDVLDASFVVVDKIWKFQPHVRELVNRLLAELNLPDEYVGFHVRRGDKFLEQQPVATHVYFDSAEQHTDLRNAFVATDDYSVIAEVRKSNPGWTIFSLCDEPRRGYYQGDFVRLSNEPVYDWIIQFLADLEALHAAQRLYLTFGSNIGMFLGMRRGRSGTDQIHSLDLPRWQVW